MSGLIILVGLGILIWFWVDSLHARERALQVCAAACRQTKAQLLDQTVSLARVGVGRNSSNRILFRRRYRFEFSTDGVNRWQGRVTLLGSLVESVQMDYPEGATILDSKVFDE
ncbi:MAG: DUF3301 domain-containing protein [Gammaproteobacteria bacterium]